MEDNLTSHEKKELKKQEKEKSRLDSEKKYSKKKIVKYAVLGLIILLVVFGLYKMVSNVKDFDPYYKGSFHWHSNINMFICGKEVKLRCNSNICGPMFTHHHNDDIIHTEGNVIAKKEDISLGSFFDEGFFK